MDLRMAKGFVGSLISPLLLLFCEGEAVGQ
jgi:hypothetical protein